MALLFLRPDTAVGLKLVVDQPVNERNSERGFKLLDPNTNLPEAIVIQATVKFEGSTEIVPSAQLDIIQETGDERFLPITNLPLPVEPVTSGDLTDLLPQSGDGAKLFVDVLFNAVKQFPIDSSFGYGYGLGFDGVGVTSGVIQYILTYTPPPFTGDYVGTITVDVSGQAPISKSRQFSILPALTAEALATLYPTSDGEALPGDLVILQLNVSGDIKDIAKVNGIPKVTVSGDLAGPASMLEASKFHPALREKWGVDANADFLLPVKVPSDGSAGFLNPTVTAEAIDGQPFTTSSNTAPATSPIVNVVSTRSSFNVYLMPSFSFLTPVLHCAPPTSLLCAQKIPPTHEFDIAELLKQPAPNVNPKFVLAIGKTTGDIIIMADVVDTIYAYDTSPPGFSFYVSDQSSLNDTLTAMGVGRGYIIQVKSTGDSINPIGPFNTKRDPDSRFPDTDIPVPIKLTFTGKIQSEPQTVIPSTIVRARWNLVGPHTEKDTTVGVYLGPVAETFERRKWLQLIAFKNLLDISLDSKGNVKLRAEGKPEIVFENRFESLRPPEGFPDAGSPPLPSGSSISAGSGLWLFMREGGELSGPLE